jgi:hypothetical protein
MEFRFDPHERRLRIRTLVPAGAGAHLCAPDDLFQFSIEEEYFLSDARTLQARNETRRNRCFSWSSAAVRGGSAAQVPAFQGTEPCECRAIHTGCAGNWRARRDSNS